MTYTLEDMQRAGCTSGRGIRYWEEQGLLGQVERSSGGRRKYSQDNLDRAKIVAAAQFGGFSLDEAKAMVDEWGGEAYEAVQIRLTQQIVAATMLRENLPEPKPAEKQEWDL